MKSRCSSNARSKARSYSHFRISFASKRRRPPPADRRSLIRATPRRSKLSSSRPPMNPARLGQAHYPTGRAETMRREVPPTVPVSRGSSTPQASCSSPSSGARRARPRRGWRIAWSLLTWPYPPRLRPSRAIPASR